MDKLFHPTLCAGFNSLGAKGNLGDAAFSKIQHLTSDICNTKHNTSISSTKFESVHTENIK